MQPNPKVQCPRCGAPVQHGDTQCPHCGAYMNNNQSYGGGYQFSGGYGPGTASPQWLANDAFADGPEGKSRGVTALLAILLGGLGVHYFYLGRVGAGLISLLLTVLSCSLWQIVVLIQGILMFCMDNQTFRNKYVINSASFPLF